MELHSLSILNDCKALQRALDDVEPRLQDLQRAQHGYLSGARSSHRDLDQIGSSIIAEYRNLADRVRYIKSQPESRSPQNALHVDNLDRRLKRAINAYQQQESSFRREVEEQQRRQYLIVNPDATEAELREVTQAGGDMQIFQQALLSADRRGHAQSALHNVKERHVAIQQIEKTMTELAELIQDLDTIVVLQDPATVDVEDQAEITKQYLEEGNVQLGHAKLKAEAARRKKWICLGISVLIFIVIIIILLIVLKVTHVI
ncbi:t-SNARE [Myriangium duriaei CBS 260.36]|uniref:t-SNARE n=1 Tax=Myriangium duriaei CBS 260.36 TaxID=1168546 RepID=A0A9P4J431_9PEZI|nr:t-SNARE [Myriangium duriaei CBS 260.36]